MTTSTTTNSPPDQPHVGRGLGSALLAALACAVLLVGLTGLSPLAAVDRVALGLLALCISLPLGAALSRPATTSRQAASGAAAALAAGALLGLLTTGPDPALAVRAMLWCAAACLLGCALAGIARGAGVVATLTWLGLCAMPFACGATGSWQPQAEAFALAGCPWLGMSQDVTGVDPLHRSVMYLGQWSAISDRAPGGFATALQLWVAAALALSALLLRSGLPARAGA